MADTSMVAVLDCSAWQCPQFNSVAMTLGPGWKAPDLTLAKARGVAGVIARCSIGPYIDPFYAPTVQAARVAPIVPGAYHWTKPYQFSIEVELSAIHQACVAAPPDFFMADVEDAKITWTGRQFLDWLFDFMGRVQIPRRVIYTGFYYWNARVSPDLAKAYATDFAKYDVVVAAYPHQAPVPAGVDQASRWPVVPGDPSAWYDWARTTQVAPDGTVDDGKLPLIPNGWDDWDGWQASSWAMARDYGFPGNTRLDCNVVKPDAWARWAAPITTPEVPAPVTIPTFPYQYGSRTVSLAEQANLDTYKRLHPEVQRRFVGLQLACLVEAGIAIGIGTAWRVQPAGQANHADPGSSYHEGMTVASKANALAIDTVSPPIHAVGWSAMEKRLRQFGFTSFTIPQIPANFNIEGRAYNGAWDRPHIQPYEVRYGRPSEAKLHGVSSPNLGPIPLGKWPIPPQYDIDLIDINNPLGGAVTPAPHPPTPIPSVPYTPTEEDDDVRFRGYYQLAGTIGIWAVYDGLKCKTWVMNLEMMAALNGQLKEQGATDAQLGLVTTDDVNGFRALGPILGEAPADVDPFGVPIAA